MRKTVWLIGCNGMLGTQIARDLAEQEIDFIGTDREVDITDYTTLESFVKANSENQRVTFDWIINCSAYTAVDNSEDEKDLAIALNVAGPKNIAQIAKKIGAKMIHLSTDYVFDGEANSPYTEDMPKKPLGFYGKTKADGEDEVLAELANNAYIVRTAWLYGCDGKNFVYTMMQLMNSRDTISVVNDQRGSPTFAVDLSNVVLKIISKERKGCAIEGGIYHCTNLGEITWFDFATEIYKKAQEKNLITGECAVNPCSSEQFPIKTKRPAYSVLSKEKIQKALNIQLPQWQESLDTFLSSPLYKK